MAWCMYVCTYQVCMFQSILGVGPVMSEFSPSRKDIRPSSAVVTREADIAEKGRRFFFP